MSAAVEATSLALCKQSLELRILGLEDAAWLYESQDWGGAKVDAFPAIGPSALGWAPKLFESLCKDLPDIAHTHGIWMATSAQVADWGRRFRKPYIVSPHGMLEPHALGISGWKKQIARRLFEDRHLTGAQCIHALNSAEADHIRKFGLRNPIAIVPNGVSIPGPRTADVPAPWVNQFAKDVPVLLFLGRVHPKKNLAGLIRAISDLKRTSRLGGWKLAVAGWGQQSHADEIKKLVSELDLNAEISLLGPLFGAEKDAALRHASAFILPSFSEGLPMAVLEAWAYGLPVAMTTACNLPAGFECGAAIEIPSTPEQMIGPLTDFLRMSGSDLEAMGRVGRKLVERDFSWDAVAASFVDLYKWALGEGARPDFVFEANDASGWAL
ncbi:MAG: glycosyltransferase [Porphyrobacter sp.]|nr:glycosyltransferase [Porphyrobacter sp.]